MHGLVYVVHHIRPICNVTVAFIPLYAWRHNLWGCPYYCHDHRKIPKNQRKIPNFDRILKYITQLQLSFEDVDLVVFFDGSNFHEEENKNNCVK